MNDFLDGLVNDLSDWLVNDLSDWLSDDLSDWLSDDLSGWFGFDDDGLCPPRNFGFRSPESLDISVRFLHQPLGAVVNWLLPDRLSSLHNLPHNPFSSLHRSPRPDRFPPLFSSDGLRGRLGDPGGGLGGGPDGRGSDGLGLGLDSGGGLGADGGGNSLSGGGLGADGGGGSPNGLVLLDSNRLRNE